MTAAAAFAQRPKAIAANNILFHTLTSKVNPGFRTGGGFLAFGQLVQREQAIVHQVEASRLVNIPPDGTSYTKAAVY
jgi:hypothetical protein